VWHTRSWPRHTRRNLSSFLICHLCPWPRVDAECPAVQSVAVNNALLRYLLAPANMREAKAVQFHKLEEL
jgi:hypothetical protein